MKPMTNATPYILKVITYSQDHRYNEMHHLRQGLKIKLIKPNSQIGLEFCSGTNKESSPIHQSDSWVRVRARALDKFLTKQ